jgi:hypothetical protein
MNNRFVASMMLSLSFCPLFAREITSNSDSSPGTMYSKVQDSVAIITSANNAGSGFIIYMDGATWLITCEHITRDWPIIAKKLSGELLQLNNTAIEIANGRDIARIKILQTNNLSVLSCNAKPPQQPILSAPVTIIGNSIGGGVATLITGSIIGVGPDLIEVNANFVRGNSGSPIIDNESGIVLGVASYISRPTNPDDWTLSQTRYANPRRYGYRLDNITWQTFSINDYSLQASILYDIEQFCYDLLDTYNDIRRAQIIQFRSDSKNYIWEKLDGCSALSDAINKFIIAYNNKINHKEALKKYYEENRKIHDNWQKSKPQGKPRGDKYELDLALMKLKIQYKQVLDCDGDILDQQLEIARSALNNQPFNDIKSAKWNDIFQEDVEYWKKVVGILLSFF